MKFSVITDEVTQDIREAVRFAKKHELDAVELRSVNNKTLDEMTDNEIGELKSILDGSGLKVCCFASPLFKCRYDDDAAYRAHIEMLKKLTERAHVMDCPFIRGFSFNRHEKYDVRRAAEMFAPALDALAGSGLALLLEADPSVNTTNCAKIAELLSEINSPLTGAIYDPGNDIYDPDGELPFPDGYRHLAGYIRHVHIKDAVKKGGKPESVKVGDGAVPFAQIFHALKNDGYNGFYSLETHYRHNREITGELLHLPKGEAFSIGGLAASDESMAALKRIAERML